MKRVVILTGHFPGQNRQTSMLWVSHHLQRMGWHVTHVSVGYSWVSVLKRDIRLSSLNRKPDIGHRVLTGTLSSLHALPPVHPFRTPSKAINRLLKPLWPIFAAHWRPRIRAPLARTDLVICESGLPVLLAPILAEYAPNVPRIFRVNDDVSLLNAPEVLIHAEEANARCFTRISTASPLLADRFAGHGNVTCDPMGIPHHLLKNVPSSPYSSVGTKAVCAGSTQIDLDALSRIADQRPNWDIHVLGRLRQRPPKRTNITWHGEQSFEVTLGHIAHADIGLAPYIDAPGIEYQTTNSNRMLLYRHFGLPILGPDRLCHPRAPQIIGYGDPDALTQCETRPKQPELIPDWSELAIRLAQNGVTDPPRDTATVPSIAVKSRMKTVPALASKA
ncbi:MAG: hypothetical protein WAO69_00305 [Aestuariivita sp.]|uniref:GumK N-terminal domain-containing glycosyltransferase n=1 Tax=Aestuariivita sp. TaxID=1872407 RepID=UPI003BB0335C